MTAVTGDFEEAVRESNRVLAVRGQVLPATSVPLNLSAQLASGKHLYGQVEIATAEEPIERVFIEPADVRANGEALERILEAEMIVIGPGSLFSSVLPNLLISDIRDAEVRAIRWQLLLIVGFFAAAFWLLELRWGNTLVLYACFSVNWSMTSARRSNVYSNSLVVGAEL